VTALSWFVFLTICVMAGQGATFAQYANYQEEITFVAEVPLLNCDGTPCIEARIGEGKPVRLVIDTGDEASVPWAMASRRCISQPPACMSPTECLTRRWG
jgi:hypothetical protein